MPYRQTCQEVIARIAMRALYVAVPGTTQREIADLFGASTRTVNDAVRRPVKDWALVLAALPAGKPKTPSAPRSTQRVKKHYLTKPPTLAQSAPCPGDRKDAKLVVLDDERSDVNIEPSDEGMEDDRDVVAIDPADNPIPTGRKQHDQG